MTLTNAQLKAQFQEMDPQDWVDELIDSSVTIAGVTATADELNALDGITATVDELNKTDGITGYLVEAAEVTFTETTGAGVYTGEITVPAGATILDIKTRSTALWTATTSALMDIGDAGDPDGWFTQIDLKATDLLVGEEINFVQTGGKQGAYLNTTTGARSAAYSASARVISGVVTTVGAAGNAGRTRMMVVYTLPTAVAATKA